MKVSEQVKGQVVWILKEHGDITSDDTPATAQLGELLAAKGVNVGASYVTTSLAQLEEDGCVERIKQGTRIQTIRLIDVGKYTDPFDPDAEPVPVEPKPQRKARGTKGLDAALAAIDKLTTPEKLMIVGQIVDDCAGEVDTIFATLRQLTGGLNG